MKRQGKNPIWTGMKLYWDDEWDYSFWHAPEWLQYEFEDGRPGVILSPDESNPVNLFSVQPRELETEVTPDDLPALTEGFMAGLQALPGCKIESQEESISGSLIILDAKHTFEEKGETRKRWVRLIYKGTRQYLLVGQGASVDDYRYWQSMFYTPITTFVIGPRPDFLGMWPPPALKERAEARRRKKAQETKA